MAQTLEIKDISTTAEIDIVAILTPKKGALERVVQIFQKATTAVQANEPGCLAYNVTQEIDVESGREQVVVVEKYIDKAAFEAHGQTPSYKEMLKAFEEEQLIDGPPTLKILKTVLGFSRD